MRVALLHTGRENLGLEYLSAALKAAGHETFAAVDLGLFGANDNLLVWPALEGLFSERDHVLGLVERKAPQVLAFSVYTTTLRWCREVAAAARAMGPVRVVFGGVHPSLLPAATAALPEVDWAVAGDGEAALPALLLDLERGGAGEGIPGVWSGRPGAAPPPVAAARVTDLDALPRPDKALLSGEHDHGADYMIAASRGCPNRCAFCCEHALARCRAEGPYLRRRSVASVLDELVWARARWGSRRVWFVDPIFTADRAWLLDFLRRYRRHVRLPFRCYGHLDSLDDETAAALARSGCYAVELGVQTLDEALRRRWMGCSMTAEEVLRRLRLCDRHGLPYEVDHLFGLPGEGRASFARAAEAYGSLRRLTRIKPHNVQLFPQTALARFVADQGRADAAAMAALDRGEADGGFFHGAVSERYLEPAPWHGAFITLFRLLPLLPAGLVRFLIWTGRVAWLGRLPRLLTLLGQVLAAAWARDRRLMVVLRVRLAQLGFHRAKRRGRKASPPGRVP